MAYEPTDLPTEVVAFLEERHLATLTTRRADGSPHVVPVGFTFEPDARLVRIITFASSQKVRNVRASPNGRAAVSQVEGGRWLTLEGTIDVTNEAHRVAEAVRRYGMRYRIPSERPDRVALEILVDRVMGRP
jgi:PPOX class probable F420-dependent enzyme